MVAQENSGELVYYDTNVLIYLSCGEIPDFLGTLTEAGYRHVASDTALEELIKGPQTEILNKHAFLYHYSHDPTYIGQPIKLHTRINLPDTSAHKDFNLGPMEAFLRSLLRSMAGSRSVEDVSTLFRNSLDDLTVSISEDLPPGTDPRIMEQLSRARESFAKGLADLPSVESPIVTKEEMEKHRVGPKYFGNLRPPNLIGLIVAQHPESKEWIDRLLIPFTDGEDIKSRIQELCIALVLLGFARDKSLGKDSLEKSEGGARAQFQDINHICCASICRLFVTSDRRCARLAYAVYEGLNIATNVVLLDRSDPENLRLVVVGEGYWP